MNKLNLSEWKNEMMMAQDVQRHIADTRYHETALHRLSHRFHDFWLSLENEKKRFGMSALACSLSIVSTSVAVSFATFIASDFFLASVLFFSVLTMVLTIAAGQLKLILLSGLMSLLMSVLAISYAIAMHWNMIAKYF